MGYDTAMHKTTTYEEIPIVKTDDQFPTEVRQYIMACIRSQKIIYYQMPNAAEIKKYKRPFADKQLIEVENFSIVF